MLDPLDIWTTQIWECIFPALVGRAKASHVPRLGPSQVEHFWRRYRRGPASTWEDPHVHDSLESSAELGVGVVAYRPCQSINF